MGKKWEGGRADSATVSWSSWALVIHKQENSLNIIEEMAGEKENVKSTTHLLEKAAFLKSWKALECSALQNSLGLSKCCLSVDGALNISYLLMLPAFGRVFM